MILYLNNYKGFKETFIPFADMNFFVGENSTGKTAVLELLELLSLESFWIDMDLSNTRVGIRHFTDILNQYQKESKTFSFGLEFKEGRHPQTEGTERILLTYKKSVDGMILSSFKFNTNGKCVRCEEKNGATFYKVRPYSIDESFKEWVYDSAKFTSVKAKRIRVSVKQAPYAVIKSIIINDLINHDITHGTFRTTIPYELRSCRWIAPIRAKAKRIYDSVSMSYSPEGEHIPLILNKLLRKKGRKGDILRRLQEFGHKSGMFDGVQTPNYGRNADSPFEILVKYDGIDSINITNVGYGIPQLLPLLVEILTSKNESFAIQQPEVHLHPRAQAAFGGFLYESVKMEHNTFYIETHSEYTINRYRYCLHEEEENVDFKSQILFFSRDSQGTHVTPITINNKGQYPEDMPEAFGKFFIDEEINMLEV